MISIFEYDEEREKALIIQSLKELAEEECKEKAHREGFEAGHLEGMQQGMQQGMEAFLALCLELNISKDDTVKQLMNKFNLSEQEAQNYLTTQ